VIRQKDKYKIISNERFYLTYHKYWNRILLERTSGTRTSLILDCGCGIATTCKLLAEDHDSVFGFDLRFDALKSAPGENNNIKIITSDAHAIGFKDESFDIVICKGTLHHLAEPHKAIKEIYRILKKEGTLLISEPCRDNFIWRNIGLIYTKYSKHFDSRHRLFYAGELMEMLSQNGFKIQKTRYLGIIAFPLCALAYLFPVMKFIPFNDYVTRVLIKIDEKIIRALFIKKFHWHIIIRSQKS